MLICTTDTGTRLVDETENDAAPSLPPLAAVMVAVPSLMPTTTPDAETTATSESTEAHRRGRPETGAQSASRGVPTSCTALPMLSEAAPGVTSMKSIGDGLTATAAV